MMIDPSPCGRMATERSGKDIGRRHAQFFKKKADRNIDQSSRGGTVGQQDDYTFPKLVGTIAMEIQRY